MKMKISFIVPVLNTEIEPARGAGKMVHQLTIHKTGGMTSSVK